jgi:hypothetical protein
MSAHFRQRRGAARSLLVREAAFVLLVCAVFGTAYAASAFDHRRFEARSAVELQAAVATQISEARSSIAEIVDGEGRFNVELSAAAGVSVSDTKDPSTYPPDLTQVLLQQEATREAWANIVNCPTSSTVVKEAESLVEGVSERAKLQSATEADKQALAIMLADLKKRLEAVKARSQNLEHVRFMVEAERLESPSRK